MGLGLYEGVALLPFYPHLSPQNANTTQAWPLRTEKLHTQQSSLNVTTYLAQAGFVFKAMQERECLRHVHLHSGVTLMQQVGWMVLILQRLMVKLPERSAFTGVETAVTGPLALK